MSNTNENNKPHELDSPLGAGLQTLPDLLPIAAALAAASPAPPRIDRDRLMFLAGAASMSSDTRPPTPDLRNATEGVPYSADLRPPTSGSAWHWPAATAALAATSLALATALFLRPAPPERIVYVPQPVELASTPARDANLTSDLRPPTSDFRSPTPDLRRKTTVHQHNYLRSRDVALRFGLDALGTPTSDSGGDAPALTYRSLLESLFPAQPRSRGEASESPQM